MRLCRYRVDAAKEPRQSPPNTRNKAVSLPSLCVLFQALFTIHPKKNIVAKKTTIQARVDSYHE